MKVYAYGESLLRFDVISNNEVKIYPTGTAINFLANMSSLEEHDSILLTALSSKKDSEIIKKWMGANDIKNNIYYSKETNLGLYTMYKNQSIFGWEVVYHRENTSWNEFSRTEQSLVNSIEKDDHFHLDGISLYSSNTSKDKTIAELNKVKSIGASISFDFNYRQTIKVKDQNKLLQIYKDVIKQADYLNISFYDFDILFGTKNSEKEIIEKIKIEFPNLKYVFGTMKKTFKNKMHIQGFIIKDSKIIKTDFIEYDPKELIGQGDSFAAYIINDLLTKRAVNLIDAVNWSIYKTNFIGDSSIQTLEEFKNYKKGINVTR